MPRVFIPTDDSMIIPGIAGEYARRGWDVVVGTRNFFHHYLSVDLVHHQWPEELTDWTSPSKQTLAEVRATLDWWAQRCPSVISVNNLYPHGAEGDPAYKELFDLFYERCVALVHYSHRSQELVLRDFPSARGKRQLVTSYFNYDRLLPPRLDRRACRAALGFSETDFVVLCFGAIRFWEELQLVLRAFDRAKIPNKRLLMCGRYNQPLRGMERRWRHLQLGMWLKKLDARVVRDFIPDEQVHTYVEASDVLLVPRLKDMTSGLIGLGLTFGRTLVAPNHGAYPEYLGGTANPLYESANADSMARAIEKTAAADRAAIEAQNRRLADQWTWDKIVGAAIAAAGLNAPPAA